VGSKLKPERVPFRDRKPLMQRRVMQMKITELMTKDPSWLDPEASIEEAWKLMHAQGVRHVPICKHDKLVGLITQKDLLVNAQNTALLSWPVAEIMVMDVLTVDVDSGLREPAKIMHDKKVSCLPVVDDGKLAGIVTETDYLGMLINFLE
jgi:CBS domain-containing membrane protein